MVETKFLLCFALENESYSNEITNENNEHVPLDLLQPGPSFLETGKYVYCLFMLIYFGIGNLPTKDI